MVGPEPVQDGVEVAGVVRPEPVVAALADRSRLGEGTVHVPLEEVDGVVAQQPVDGGVQPVGDLRPGQVEHQLVALQRPGAAGEVVHPVRVRAVQVEGGRVTVTGLDMLLHQAFRQFELITGVTAPVRAMRLGLLEGSKTDLPLPV